MATTVEEPRQARVKIPQGKALLVIAETYPTLMQVLLEGVQNALDADATRIKVVIDLAKRIASVSDNGTGAGVKKFNDALESVLHSVKDSGKLGRFGRGLVSGLGKCERFTFTSVPEGREGQGYNTWTFVTEDILGMHDQVYIPHSQQQDIVFEQADLLEPERRRLARQGKSLVWWRTKMTFQKVVKDRAITRIEPEELVESIRGKFGNAMKRLGAKVSVSFTDEEGRHTGDQDIMAVEYDGKQLEPVVYTDDDAGRVVVGLYLTRLVAGKRRGKVHFSVEGDAFRLSAEEFCSSSTNLVDNDVVEALLSGYFEGDVTGEKIALDPNRKQFKLNDALISFCDKVNCWYKDVGNAHFAEDLDERRQQQYQQAGLVAMEELQEMLRGDQYADILARFKFGTVGEGHKKVRVESEDESTTLAAQGGSLHPRTENGSGGGSNTAPKYEIPGHRPGIVEGPRGKRRKVVKGGSVGLAFKYEEMPTTMEVYHFDSKRGVVYFNTRNPNFGKCARTVFQLSKYQLAVAQLALVASRHEDKSAYDAVRHALLEKLEMEVRSILESTSLMRRIRAFKKVAAP